MVGRIEDTRSWDHYFNKLRDGSDVIKKLCDENLEHMLSKKREAERKRRGEKKNIENTYGLSHRMKLQSGKSKTMSYEDILKVSIALQNKEAEEEKKRNELKAKEKLERKSRVLVKFDGKSRYLVEHGFSFTKFEKMNIKEVDVKFNLL